MTVYIFDTETADRDGEIIEAAWLRVDPTPGLFGSQPDEIPHDLELAISTRFCQRYKPAKPLTCGSIAVHHILPFELNECAPSASFALPSDASYVIGHSIDYDWMASGSPAHVRRICTDAMARHVWPEATGYSQVALIYMLLGANKVTRDRVRSAHSAAADVQLNLILLSRILQAKPEIRTWSALWDFSELCREPLTCRFKQYRDIKLEDVPLDFIEWVLRQHFITVYERRAYQRAWAKITGSDAVQSVLDADSEVPY